MGKTIKQIADELCVSKQAVWQRVKRSSDLTAMLVTHSTTVNGTIYVDAEMEQSIKMQYPDRLTVDGGGVNITETSVNEGVNVDGRGVNIAETTVNKGVNVDGRGVNVDVNTLIETLQKTVESLQHQLIVKDKHIN